MKRRAAIALVLMLTIPSGAAHSTHDLAKIVHSNHFKVNYGEYSPDMERNIYCIDFALWAREFLVYNGYDAQIIANENHAIVGINVSDGYMQLDPSIDTANSLGLIAVVVDDNYTPTNEFNDELGLKSHFNDMILDGGDNIIPNYI